MTDEKCAMCKSDIDDLGNSHFHIQDLCPTDRKRIARLVEKFAVCTQMKNKIESNLMEVKSENEALINRYELFTSQHEEENNKLKSKLAETTAELNKLRLQMAYTLDVLTDQVKTQEYEYSKVTDAVRDILLEKLKLENAMSERDARIRTAEAKIERTKEQAVMEKLLFYKQHMNMINSVEKINRSCQTDEYVHHNFITNLKIKYEPNKLLNLEKSQSLNDIKPEKHSAKKSRDDLKSPSAEGMNDQQMISKNSDDKLISKI